MSTSFEPVSGDDAKEVPVRLLVVQEDLRPAVDVHDEDMVMTFPHLVVRELIALLAFSLAIVCVSLVFDAPLEELANAQKTPNPAKAPWYFLGLQELLHYYSPLVSGVILPGLVVLGLVVVPYMSINLERRPFWETDRTLKLGTMGIVLAGLTVFFYVSGDHPVWAVILPTWAIALVMSLPALVPGRAGRLGWIERRSLPFWIFLWFLLIAVLLTVIGVFFRGPGWAFTLPWVDGIYY